MDDLTERPHDPVTALFPNLAGKTALVTGCSRGIGCGIARELGRQKMRLVLAARSEERGRAFAATLIEDGMEVCWVTADLTRREDAQRLVETAVDTFGAVDLLVNNAAQLRSRPFLELDETWYRQSLVDNVHMVYGPSWFAARHMADHGGGGIIHISSVGATRSHRGLSGYDASNGAINTLTRSMALDLAPHGIRVNAVAPGATFSVTTNERTRSAFDRRARGIPLGRLGGPEEMGAAVAFLASDAAAYITGQVLHVDGGLTAQLTPPGIFI